MVLIPMTIMVKINLNGIYVIQDNMVGSSGESVKVILTILFNLTARLSETLIFVAARIFKVVIVNKVFKGCHLVV